MGAFLALNGGAVLAAFTLAVALGLGGRASRWLLGTLGGYLVIVHSAVLAAGLAGYLTLAGLAALVGAAGVGAVWMLRRTRPSAEGDAGEIPGDQPRFTAATLFPPVVAVINGVVWAWPHLVQPTRLWVWDDYTYHMVYPVLWLREHAISAATPAQAFTMQAWFPLSGDLVAAWFMAPFHGSRGEALAWVSLTGILYGGIVAVGGAELLARLGCRRGAWAVPVVLLATSRRIEVMASSFSDVDLALAAALFGAFVFAVPRGEIERGPDVAVDAMYAALLSGVALGVKVSAVPVGLIILGMLVLRVRRSAPPSRWWSRWRSSVWTVAIFVVAWTATGGYWYARNVVHTGNPVYPAAFLLWPGATFPETTLLEYGHRYGLHRTVADALAVYMNWPPSHAALAVMGLLGLVGWLTRSTWGASNGPPKPPGARTRPGEAVARLENLDDGCDRRRSTTSARRSFASAALVIVATLLLLLPAAPFSAGNAMTFRAGFVHWDSMRYVALLPILGWTALGFLIAAGAGARWWRTLAAVAIVAVGLLTSVTLPVAAALAALAAGVALLVRARRTAWPRRTLRHAAVATGVVAMTVATVVVWAHDTKATATGAAILGDPLFGGAAAVLDRQPPGTRVAVFGDQWVYPTFGDRHQLRPVRLDRDGRVASAPIGDEMAPQSVSVDPSIFRANLRAAGIGVVVVVHQPHPGRSAERPSQHAALEAGADARLLYRDRAVAVWKLDP